MSFVILFARLRILETHLNSLWGQLSKRWDICSDLFDASCAIARNPIRSSLEPRAQNQVSAALRHIAHVLSLQDVGPLGSICDCFGKGSAIYLASFETYSVADSSEPAAPSESAMKCPVEKVHALKNVDTVRRRKGQDGCSAA